jgi:hypothetical protein
MSRCVDGQSLRWVEEMQGLLKPLRPLRSLRPLRARRVLQRQPQGVVTTTTTPTAGGGVVV